MHPENVSGALPLHLHASWKCFGRSEGLFFCNKSILVWAFFQIEMLFSDKNNPWLKILSNKDAFHHHKVIPARIFFQIRITPSPKSNLWQNVLPNKDASYRNKAMYGCIPSPPEASFPRLRCIFLQHGCHRLLNFSHKSISFLKFIPLFHPHILSLMLHLFP